MDKLILPKAFAITGLMIVLDHHIQMDWWEPAVLTFGIMMLWGRL
jgi:hypothetical protein